MRHNKTTVRGIPLDAGVMVGEIEIPDHPTTASAAEIETLRQRIAALETQLETAVVNNHLFGFPMRVAFNKEPIEKVALAMNRHMADMAGTALAVERSMVVAYLQKIGLPDIAHDIELKLHHASDSPPADRD